MIYRAGDLVRVPFHAQDGSAPITGLTSSMFDVSLALAGEAASETVTITEGAVAGDYEATFTQSASFSGDSCVYLLVIRTNGTAIAQMANVIDRDIQVFRAGAIIPPGTGRAIVSLATLKAWVPQARGGDDDDLRRLISAATAWIESRTGRLFVSAEVTEWHEHRGIGGSHACGGQWGGPYPLSRHDETLVTRYAPIVSVDTVTENAIDLSVASEYSTDADVLAYLEKGELVRRSSRWARGHLNVKVIYTAGYSEMPPEIVQLCCEVANLMDKEGALGGLTEVMSGGDRRIYITRSLSPASQDALTDYHDWRVTTAVETRLAA